MFQEDVVFFEPRPLDTIKNLRSSGLSLTEIAAQTGTPATVVRRLVEKTDWAKIKRQHEEVAVRIDRETGTVGGRNGQEFGNLLACITPG